MTATPDWRRLTDIVMAVPERIYEGWNSKVGYNNLTIFGKQYGWDGVAWCVMYDWCMYEDAKLEKIVPKVASVSVFTDWAKRNKQWSAYPSVGAWVNFSNGGHTELVIGFDETYVYTKGGNSIVAGAADAGQGNGVWTHKTERRAARIVGYFAPKFPDGVCPPTADPADPRGGKAVKSWRYSKAATTPSTGTPKPTLPAFPGRSYFLLGAKNSHAKQLQTWLAKGKFGPAYKVGPSETMSQIDIDKVKALQKHFVSALGPADGLCGPKTWQYAFEVANGLRKK
ncbi:hypothetical protein QFZ75_007878 [Streptomyces sp. V3I8]|uniref:hypothetical protein n=1 Tax=Streptomyces sp. V3I8 TaxID=3042279 RepID=UPI002783D1C3|nr:hypothetical protein [Streptomyces sp. V3I8]MDQ1041376.1 hypothetical protein [Streptomyces sp. V3I8]